MLSGCDVIQQQVLMMMMTKIMMMMIIIRPIFIFTRSTKLIQIQIQKVQ